MRRHMQNVTFLWVPWRVEFTTHSGLNAWLRLPGHLVIGWDFDLDDCERIAWQFGKLKLTRPETEAEEDERLAGESEAMADEYFANYYTEWSY